MPSQASRAACDEQRTNKTQFADRASAEMREKRQRRSAGGGQCCCASMQASSRWRALWFVISQHLKLGGAK
eukprot:2745958-Rhodomonas_salina.1